MNPRKGQAHSPFSQGLAVAKLRLGDLEREERQIAEHAMAFVESKMTFGDALAIYHQHAGMLLRSSIALIISPAHLEMGR